MDITSLFLAEEPGLDDHGQFTVGKVALRGVTMPPQDVDLDEAKFPLVMIWHGRTSDEFVVRLVIEDPEGSTRAMRLPASALSALDDDAGIAAAMIPASRIASMPGRWRIDATVADPPGGGTWIDYDVRPAQPAS